jgi:CrcB protein
VSTRPHLHPGLVLAVAAGGVVGTTARATLTGAVGQVGGWPLGTLTENVVGSFLLGMLLEALLRAGQETPRARVVRLGLGTGVLGGFTTFSSFALEVERLLAGGEAGIAAGYAGASLVLGLLACAGGIVLGARLRPRTALRRVLRREPRR